MRRAGCRLLSPADRLLCAADGNHAYGAAPFAKRRPLPGPQSCGRRTRRLQLKSIAYALVSPSLSWQAHRYDGPPSNTTVQPVHMPLPSKPPHPLSHPPTTHSPPTHLLTTLPLSHTLTCPAPPTHPPFNCPPTTTHPPTHPPFHSTPQQGAQRDAGDCRRRRPRRGGQGG
jgi:hypothetical protein